ncbi:hypothetical protein T484DRAFT_3353988 [Baffinella frigidus]|nr:hypothetical protein T484DRAFT_3353988 [Cryptophyta sp. CCMP2293]
MNKKKWRVLTSTLPLRASPSNDAPILQRIAKNAIFEGEPLDKVRWIRVPKTRAHPECFALLFDERTGHTTCQISVEGEHRLETIRLLIDMSKTRHLCLELCRLQELEDSLHFLATSAPRLSAIKPLAQELVQRLNTGKLLLEGRRNPGRPARDRAFNSGAVPKALADYGMQTAGSRLAGPRAELTRTDLDVNSGGPATGTNIDKHRQAALRDQALPPHLQPVDLVYGTGIHAIMHPTSATSLRAASPGFSLGLPRGGALEYVRQKAGDISGSWLREGDPVSSFDADI